MNSIPLELIAKAQNIGYTLYLGPEILGVDGLPKIVRLKEALIREFELENSYLSCTLSELAQLCEVKGGRERLLDVIKNAWLSNNVSTVPSKLALISQLSAKGNFEIVTSSWEDHLETIVNRNNDESATTSIDEVVSSKRAQLTRLYGQLSNIRSSEFVITHGDLMKLYGVLVTSDDDNFRKRMEIADKFTNNPIVFVGHNSELHELSQTFLLLKSLLLKNEEKEGREIYLVSKDIEPLDILFWQSLGVDIIKLSDDDFIEELFVNLNGFFDRSVELDLIGNDNNSYLIWGGSGVGKSKLLQKLILNSYKNMLFYDFSEIEGQDDLVVCSNILESFIRSLSGQSIYSATWDELEKNLNTFKELFEKSNIKLIFMDSVDLLETKRRAVSWLTRFLLEFTIWVCNPDAKFVACSKKPWIDFDAELSSRRLRRLELNPLGESGLSEAALFFSTLGTLAYVKTPDVARLVQKLEFITLGHPQCVSYVMDKFVEGLRKGEELQTYIESFFSHENSRTLVREIVEIVLDPTGILLSDKVLFSLRKVNLPVLRRMSTQNSVNISNFNEWMGRLVEDGLVTVEGMAGYSTNKVTSWLLTLFTSADNPSHFASIQAAALLTFEESFNKSPSLEWQIVCVNEILYHFILSEILPFQDHDSSDLFGKVELRLSQYIRHLPVNDWFVQEQIQNIYSGLKKNLQEDRVLEMLFESVAPEGYGSYVKLIDKVFNSL